MFVVQLVDDVVSMLAYAFVFHDSYVSPHELDHKLDIEHPYIDDNDSIHTDY